MKSDRRAKADAEWLMENSENVDAVDEWLAAEEKSSDQVETKGIV